MHTEVLQSQIKLFPWSTSQLTSLKLNTLRITLRKSRFYLIFQIYFWNPAYIWGINNYIHSSLIPVWNYAQVLSLKSNSGSTYYQKVVVSRWGVTLQRSCAVRRCGLHLVGNFAAQGFLISLLGHENFSRLFWLHTHSFQNLMTCLPFMSPPSRALSPAPVPVWALSHCIIHLSASPSPSSTPTLLCRGEDLFCSLLCPWNLAQCLTFWRDKSTMGSWFSPAQAQVSLHELLCDHK